MHPGQPEFLPASPAQAMSLKLALDRSVLRAFLRPVGGGPAWEATAELLQLGATLYVLPLVAEELEAESDEVHRRWRDAAVAEIQPDDFLRGCAAGIARRYLDYHPDPRDCRLVAEAECAKMDVLLTLSDDLIAGLSRRVEAIRIEKPWDTAARTRRTGIARDAL